jgi:hypothetical protein
MRIIRTALGDNRIANPAEPACAIRLRAMLLAGIGLALLPNSASAQMSGQKQVGMPAKQGYWWYETPPAPLPIRAPTPTI